MKNKTDIEISALGERNDSIILSKASPRDAMTKNEQNTGYSIDGILKLIGEFNRFQWLLEIFLCFIYLPGIFQIFIMYFATLEPNWKCVQNSTVCTLNGTYTSENEYRCSIPRSQWQFVEEREYSIIIDYNIYCHNDWLIHMTSSLFFFGRLVGFVVCGWLSDKYGRKPILFPCFILLLCFVLLSTLMPSIEWFLFCRFVIGFVGAGYGNLIFILVSEFVSTKYRPAANNLMWVVWSTALCFLALQAYLIHNWKIFFIVCSAPYLIGIACIKFVPESVRWLRSKGQLDKAMDIFKRIADWNRSELDEKVSLAEAPIANNSKKVTHLDLFKTKKMAVSTITQCFLLLVNAMVYYGISLAADDLGGSIYLNFVYVSLVELPAAFIAIDFSNRFGRRRTTCFSILMAGIFCIVVALVPTSISQGSIIRVVVGVLGKLFITLSYDVVLTWSLELFPTDVRSTGFSCVQLAGSIGSTASPWISKGLKVYHKNLPFYVMGSFALIAGIVGFILPETKGLETKDSLEEEMV